MAIAMAQWWWCTRNGGEASGDDATGNAVGGVKVTQARATSAGWNGGDGCNTNTSDRNSSRNGERW